MAILGEEGVSEEVGGLSRHFLVLLRRQGPVMLCRVGQRNARLQEWAFAVWEDRKAGVAVLPQQGLSLQSFA